MRSCQAPQKLLLLGVPCGMKEDVRSTARPWPALCSFRRSLSAWLGHYCFHWAIEVTGVQGGEGLAWRLWMLRSTHLIRLSFPPWHHPRTSEASVGSENSPEVTAPQPTVSRSGLPCPCTMVGLPFPGHSAASLWRPHCFPRTVPGSWSEDMRTSGPLL